jgi:hypothetical protein
VALDYVTNPTGIFFRIGPIVAATNDHGVVGATTLPAELKSIVDNYEAADMTGQISGIYASYTGFQQQQTAIRQQLGSFVDATLTDQATVLNELGVSSSIQAVLPALIRRMLDDGESVNHCTVTVGAVTAASYNVGNGTVLLTKVLDGFNPPVLGGLATVDYDGLDSELAVTGETMQFICTSDSGRDGAPEGGETFSWAGGLSADQLDAYRPEGSGQGPSLRGAAVSGLVTDGSFENWGGTGNNTPTSWAITDGTAGTHILRESDEVYRGSFSLAMVGDGGQATIAVQQAISPSRLKGRRMYNVSVRVKASTVPSVGTIKVNFTGTGYTPGSVGIEISAANFPGDWTLYDFFISMPPVIPADWALRLAVEDSLEDNAEVYFDSLCFAEVVYHGGVGAVLVPGDEPFAAGDKFTVDIANDDAGVFQTYFRRKYRCQLPSDADGSGGESIPDSLAM